MNTNPVFERIRHEITETPVVLYMKGTPMFPQCGFSAAAVDILTRLGVKFKGVDVLVDPSLREGLKAFANWPTFPQLYVKGELVGGCDIMREMSASGELKQLMTDKGITAD
ncbi:MAG: Grx4 family monothiol glutaredoxin [Alphaproteobacteria bacterium]